MGVGAWMRHAAQLGSLMSPAIAVCCAANGLRACAGAPGTNPEELIAAAHAGCFTMALTHALGSAGHVPAHIRTVARVHLGATAAGPTITRIELETEGAVPGLEERQFVEYAEGAKKGCLVSRALAGVATITVKAELSAEDKRISRRARADQRP